MRTLRVVTCLPTVLMMGIAGCGAAAPAGQRAPSGRSVPTSRPVSTEPRTGHVSCTAGLQLGPRGGAGPPAWIISAEGLAHLAAAGLPSAVLSGEFNRPGALVLARSGTPDPLAPRASLAFVFESAGTLIAALRRNQVPATVRYLLLDLESWPLTPLAEQVSPIPSLRDAVAAAHAHGKCVVFTPALDLMSELVPPAPYPALFESFDRQIVRPGAAASDIFEVQAQHTEGTAFAAAFAPGAVATARAAHPGNPVLVGLSTNPNGQRVTPNDLLALYRYAASAGASGYWLNIAGRSPECPQCGIPQTQVAVTFLETLAKGQGSVGAP